MTYETQFDPDETPATVAVVIAMEEATINSPSRLPPLFESIDPDGLEAILDRNQDAEVRFQYAGMLVVVYGTGRIVIQDSTETG
jgi:hypothetical protein